MKPTECRSCCNETFVDGRCTHPDCRHRELSPTEIDAYQQRAIKKATRFVDELQEELFSEVGVRNAYLIAAYALQNAYLGDRAEWLRVFAAAPFPQRHFRR